MTPCYEIVEVIITNMAFFENLPEMLTCFLVWCLDGGFRVHQHPTKGTCQVDPELMVGSGHYSNYTSVEITRIKIPTLGGGFKYFLFSPLLGEDSHFD